MQEPTPTEPNMTDLPDLYSRMPENWQKWKKTGTNEQKNRILRDLGFYNSKRPLSTTFLTQDWALLGLEGRTGPRQGRD